MLTAWHGSIMVNTLDLQSRGRCTSCVTVGDRSFATAGPRIWNTLPRDVTTATVLLSFRRKLKTHLFWQSYPDIVV